MEYPPSNVEVVAGCREIFPISTRITKFVAHTRGVTTGRRRGMMIVEGCIMIKLTGPFGSHGG